MSTTAAILFVIGALVAAAFTIRLLWPRPCWEAGAETNWEQRNNLESPSLESFSAPQSLSDIHVGLGTQDVNGGR